MAISAVILTKDTSETLKQCLDCLSWCDELIVIDDCSTDETVAIAKKNDAKVIIHRLENNFSKQRNFALEQVTSDWVFFVDADEIVSNELKTEIQNKIQTFANVPVNGFLIRRQDVLWGKNMLHGEWGHQRLLRLGRKDAGYWQGKVHETWEIKGEVRKLDNSLLHYPHKTISEFLKEINFYTTLRAQELYDQHIGVTWIDIILYPKAKFLVNYIFKLGFLDGIPGLITAILMSLHSFLVRGKLWQLHQKQS